MMKMFGEKMDFLDLFGVVIMVLFILSVVSLLSGAAGESKAVKKYETEIKELKSQVETVRTQVNQAQELLLEKTNTKIKEIKSTFKKHKIEQIGEIKFVPAPYNYIGVFRSRKLKVCFVVVGQSEYEVYQKAFVRILCRENGIDCRD